MGDEPIDQAGPEGGTGPAPSEPANLTELLDLAPTGAIVRTFGSDTIVYWSRGAAELYGWTSAEALGQVTHALLRTRFPESRAAVDAALHSIGSWSGELVHTRRDGREVVVASRQAVLTDARARPTVTLELNTDITSTRHLEMTLRESEERFRLLVDNIQDYAIFMLSAEGVVLTWNEGAQRLQGYAPDEIIGQRFERFYTPEAVAADLPARLLARAESEGRAHDEGWRIRKDGSRFWADVIIRPLRDASAQLRGYVKITRDLTEQRRAEEARAHASREEGARAAAEAAQADIRASRDQLAAILTGVTDGITAIEPAGRIVFANVEAARLCGFASLDAFLAASPAQILQHFELIDEHGQPLPAEATPTRQAFSGVTPPEALLRFRVRANGEERWSLVSAVPIKDADGHVQLVVSIFRDITERKQSEDMARFLASVNLELSRSLDASVIPQTIADLAVPVLADRCVVDVASEGSGSVDGSGLLLLSDVSAADLERLGLNVVEPPQSQPIRSLISVPLRARARRLGTLTLITAESGRHFGPRELAIAEDLALRAALALDNALLYRDAQQQTETHVQLNVALRDAMAQLEQVLAAREEFLASASHDLKTPIASIKAMAQLLQRRLARTGSVSSEQLHETLTRIDAVATRASAQVQELLDLTRMRLDQPLDLDREHCDLVQLARDVVAEHQHANEDRTLRFEPSVPTLTGDWDGRRLARALSNIVDNALKYSPVHTQVTVRVWREDANDGWAVLSVEDQGVGIPPEDLHQVFERFQRGRNVVGRVSGTGIGLASARHIVQSHGGSIGATSVLNAGTTLTVRLPLPPRLAAQ